MNIENIVIVLGSTNDSLGNISKIGKQRLNKGGDLLSIYNKSGLILTGGYGSHFNSTDKPYFFYAKQYLATKGIDENKIIDCVLSTDTIEDAKLALPIVKKYNSKTSVHIVSSDFHMERVKYIFKRVFKGIDITYHEVIYIAEKEEIEELNNTEKRELKLLKETGKSSIGTVL